MVILQERLHFPHNEYILNRPLFISLQVLYVYDLHKLAVSIIVYDLHKECLPHHLMQYYERMNHAYGTTCKEKSMLRLPVRSNARHGMHSFSYIGAMFLNSLPLSINEKKQQTNHQVFIS